MNRREIVAVITDAAHALSAIPPGRVDSLAGTIAFQSDILAFRARFTRLVWAIQEDDGTEARRILAEIQAKPPV